jgi:hypothetical protein
MIGDILFEKSPKFLTMGIVSTHGQLFSEA